MRFCLMRQYMGITDIVNESDNREDLIKAMRGMVQHYESHGYDCEFDINNDTLTAYGTLRHRPVKFYIHKLG